MIRRNRLISLAGRILPFKKTSCRLSYIMGKKSSKKASSALAMTVKTTVSTGNLSRMHKMMIGLFALFVSVTALQWITSSLISAIQKTRYDDNPFQHLFDEPSVDENNQITPLLVSKVMVKTMLRFVIEKGYSTQSASVLDVGCGYGRMVEAWREAGVTNSYGVEWQPESASKWPIRLQDEYYRLVDFDVILNPNMQSSSIMATKFVTSFEVASSIMPDKVAQFVQLLTVHNPRLVFFTASTPGTDHGNGPAHLNQQPFEYWINIFAEHGYHVDWATTAQFKLALMSLGRGDEGVAMAKSWWYAKHMLIFSPDQWSLNSDQLLLAVPKSFSIIDPKLLYWLGWSHKVGKLWERDLRDFGRLFQDAKNQVHSQYKNMDEF